jgi:hypothetical protein
LLHVASKDGYINEARDLRKLDDRVGAQVFHVVVRLLRLASPRQ